MKEGTFYIYVEERNVVSELDRRRRRRRLAPFTFRCAVLANGFSSGNMIREFYQQLHRQIDTDLLMGDIQLMRSFPS